MLRLTIVAVGKLHEPFKTIAQEYAKRLTPFAKIAIKEVAAAHFRSERDRERVLREEGDRLAAALPRGALNVALTERGEELGSRQFADFLSPYDTKGREIVIALGGPLGLSAALQSAADRVLSLSRLTFTHELARIVLLEQLYRAATILGGKTYHY